MKKIFKTLSLVILAISISTLAYAQGSDYKAAITVNPLSMLFGTFNAEANIRLADSLSVLISGSYWGLDSGYWDYTAFGVGTGIKFYWQGSAIHGWYVGPMLDFAFASAEYTDPWTSEKATGSATGISFGGLIGYQSIFDSGVTIDFGLGVQVISIPDVSVEVGGLTVASGSQSWTLPLIKLAVGYAF
ncbi:MAG: DUF3575 domain-containing protein [Spirochaetes bacterium]|nr:DUF3575 domain-containing protein [Spirochaetota bacterium]